jgi:hypothetical protein
MPIWASQDPCLYADLRLSGYVASTLWVLAAALLVALAAWSAGPQWAV